MWLVDIFTLSLLATVCNSLAIGPVSYTHLDVYKRQVSGSKGIFHLPYFSLFLQHIVLNCLMFVFKLYYKSMRKKVICWLWEKGGVFEILNQILLEWLSLCLNMCVWLRDRNLRLICKNKPSGGRGWSIYAKIEPKQIWVFIWSDFALVLLALCCVGIKHQKGGDWKGNVPLGHF